MERPDHSHSADLEILPYERREARVKAWDPRTVEVAAAVAAMIRRRRPDLAVEHIGSTAVPGLPGKGIVDLSTETAPDDVERVVEMLYGLGFGPQPGPDPWPPTRPMLVGAVRLDGDEFRIHLHVQPTGGDHARDLAFRDALRSDPGLLRQYTELKEGITRGGAVEGYRYTHSKTNWILGVYRRLGFQIPAIEAPAMIGLLGGDDLARQTAVAAHALGYRVAVLDPDPGCPAAPAADRFEQGALDDPAAARRLAAGCAVVTACDERVSHEILRAIDDGEVAVRPGPYAIRVTHDRLELRRYLEANGVRVADGRASGTDAELSVVVARGADGTIASYPVGRDERETEAEAVALAADLAADLAVEMAADLATGLGLVGLLTVEMHLGLGGAFAVRKLVPRPSSTGLWTTETTTTGQFEQLVRAICGLPLGPTDLWPGQAAATLRRDAERSAAPGRNMGGVSAAAGPPAGSEDTEAGTA